MHIVPPGTFVPPEPADFPWDEPNYLGYLYYIPAQLHDRLLLLTDNANLALSIGIGHWILARFHELDNDPEPRQFVDAVWAEMTEDWHCARYYPPDDLWHGPVRGPMVVVMTILYDSIAGLDDNPFLADRAVWMHNLARHVVAPLGAFELWFEAVVSRLETLHTWKAEGIGEANLFDDDFPRGAVLSPEVLMPDMPYDPRQSESLCRRFVERQRRDGNPFVLDDAEFAGTDDGEDD